MNKKIYKPLISLCMALVLMLSILLPIGQSDTKKASALSPYYEYFEDADAVYYFSDCEPAFKDYLDLYSVVPVLYDIQPLLTPQKLAFMLYTGYFWGFNEENTNIVIIELRSNAVDCWILNELFECLNAQGCKVMFISPYQPELEEDLEYLDVSMPYNMDAYARFLKNVVRYMLDEDGYLRDNSTLFADGRFFGLQGLLTEQSYDALSIFVQSPTLQRLLLYMYHGCDPYVEMGFEEAIYQALWNDFTEDFNWEVDYFNEDTDASLYIPLWANDVDGISDYFQDQYEDAYIEQAYDYYESICEELLSGHNIHLLAHVTGYQFVDLLNNSNTAFCTFSNYSEIFTDDRFTTPYLYAMGIWTLQDDLSYFYEYIQINLGSIYLTYGIDIIDDFVVSIWEEDPFVSTGNGLRVRRGSSMQENASNQCGCGDNCPECKQYDEGDSEDIFEDLFLSLLAD